MPAVVILATSDTGLADAWERQLPAGRTALRIGAPGFPGATTPGFAAVVVLDSTAEAGLAPGFARCPTIFVGEPRSLPFEQARLAGRAKVYLSYEESATRLGEFLPLVEEVSEKQSMLDLLVEKIVRRADPPARSARSGSGPFETTEFWNFLEGAVENLESRDLLIAEFRRASRHLLHASHAMFFLREDDVFRADRGTSSFPADDVLVGFFERHPVVIDGTVLDGPADPVSEVAVRNRLALWGARLLVPIHDNGRLLGLIALGVRDDGQPYDEADRTRAVFIARLLRHFLAKSAQVSRLSLVADQVSLGARYLPCTLVLGPDESAPRHVPLVVRDLIGRARRSRQNCRVLPSEEQPFRAGAGMIAENGGIWAAWEEASGERHDAAALHSADRRDLFRELGLTLGHEMSNSLVSLAMLRHGDRESPPAPALLEAVRADISRLEGVNRNFGLMQTLHEAVAGPVDVRDVARSLGGKLGIRVEVGPDPVMLSISRELVEFALRSLIETVAENHPDGADRGLALQVRSTGEGVEHTVLLSLKGKNLELEGVLPEPTANAVPNQGRLGVFLAKEILRLHRGEIHAGPGMEGTEILISIRSF